jgi:endogenous inhibitor of DNA gyrase (YacG/DUF329 family)
MIQGRCPVCSRPFSIAALADLPSFPFCSERCRLIDLGRWIDGSYAFPDRSPGAEAPGPSDPDPGEEEDD